MAPIDEALEYLRSQDVINYSDVARRFNVNQTTLSKRWRGRTGSKTDSTDAKSLLTTKQQASLVSYINKLTLRGLPPIHLIVQLFAQDISKKEPGKNWVQRFLKTHEKELTSSYLSGIDTAHQQADNIEQFKLYFKLVSSSILYSSSTNLQ
jgi:hypothetical protein